MVISVCTEEGTCSLHTTCVGPLITLTICSFYPRSKMESNLQTAHGNVAPGNLAVGGTAAAAAAAHHHPSTSQPSTSKPHTTHHHPHHPHHPHTSHYYYSKEQRSQQQMELARALLDLPQPRSPARSGGYHTPSPKPSPGKSRSPAKKKLSSASPGEREGYYPCNRCGRSVMRGYIIHVVL